MDRALASGKSRNLAVLPKQSTNRELSSPFVVSRAPAACQENTSNAVANAGDFFLSEAGLPTVAYFYELARDRNKECAISSPKPRCSSEIQLRPAALSFVGYESGILALDLS
jgi:hypothetical protein